MTDYDALDRIELVCGDITRQEVDAIVNAANTSLLGGGGVDGAIHRAAGPELMAACRTLGGCATGSAKITPAFALKADHVIHAVGPVYHDGKSGEDRLLASCYTEALRLAADNGCTSVAVPAISCGVFGYPVAEAARMSIDAVTAFLAGSKQPQTVRFVLFTESVYSDFADTLRGRRGA